MLKNVLDTTSVNTIYESLSDIIQSDSDKLRNFIRDNFEKYSYKEFYELDLNSFYRQFNIKKEKFYFESISINHVTSRLMSSDDLSEFRIDNLEGVLLSDNTLTKFLKENQIEFLKENGIVVYYNNKVAKFDGYTEPRIIKRLERLKDSCVNGFLFSDEMPYIYSYLTGIPEIVSDILTALNRNDLKEIYFKNMKCFVATIKVDIDEFIFDDLSEIKSRSVKSQIILKYILSYLYLKYTEDKYYNFKNPIIRLPEDKNINNKDIIKIKEIHNYKEIFRS